MEQKHVHVKIEGRVQGVGYRAWTVATAHHFGLKGWVRNRMDGWVEAVFAGPAEIVDKMLAECEEGPPAAEVKHIAVQDYNQAIDDADFMARETV